MNSIDFCTCADHDCPMHPTKHDKECTPCIEKNLRFGEIPSCFFNAVKGEEKLTSYYFEDFAKLVMGKLD